MIDYTQYMVSLEDNILHKLTFLYHLYGLYKRHHVLNKTRCPKNYGQYWKFSSGSKITLRSHSTLECDSKFIRRMNVWRMFFLLISCKNNVVDIKPNTLYFLWKVIMSMYWLPCHSKHIRTLLISKTYTEWRPFLVPSYNQYLDIP